MSLPERKKAPYVEPLIFALLTYCLVESGLFVVEVSVAAELFVVVVSVPVPVVVCGVSQAAIESAVRATNRMRFIRLLFKLIK